MTVSARDRKLLLAVVPIALLVGFWLLLLSPKREEAKAAGEKLAAAQEQLDAARGQVAQAERARATFAADYEAVVSLGKAIPAKVDMPSLLVQLDTAARGTRIRFERVVAGERGPAGAAAAAATPAPDPAAAGGQGAAEPAQSAPGRAAENAQGTVDAANADAAGAGATTEQGQPAPAAAAGTPQPAAGAPSAPGLESVPVEFAFRGRFFDLADLLHELKRFVYVGQAGEVVVRGRLMTIDQVAFRPGPGGRIEATIKATAFLAPRAEGVTAGATPTGPAPSPPTQTASDAGGAPPAPPTAARLP